MLKMLMQMFAFLLVMRILPDDGAGTANDEDEQNSQNTKPQVANESQTDNEEDKVFQQTLAKDEAKLSLLQEEYNTLADRLHDEFETIVDKNPQSIFTPEEIELLEVGSSLGEKNRLLRDKFEEFRTKKLDEKKQIIDKFGNELNQRKDQYGRESIAKKFARENPDVNMDTLAEFIQEDLSPRRKKEMLNEAGDDKYKFLTLVADEYKKQNGGAKASDDEGELPPDLNMLSGESPKDMGQPQMKQSDYLKQIGAIR